MIRFPLLVCIFVLMVSSGLSYAQDFPLGIMSVGIADFPRVAAAGFTIVHNYAFESNEDDDNPTVNNETHVRKYLDAAAKSGLQAMIGFSRHALKRGDINYVKRRVSALKDHPALFGWYLYDEPEREAGKYVTPADLRRVYDAIKSSDGRHPVIISSYSVFLPDNGYLNALDILAADQYPIPQYSPDFILTRIDPAVKSTGPKGKSSWAILQAHDTGLYASKKRTRYPTKAEMRSMGYLSLMHGVKGILFYCYNDGINNIGAADASSHWDDLAAVVKEFKSLGPLFTSPAKAVLSPLPAIVLEQWTKEYDGALYVIVANRSNHTMRSDIRLGGSAKKDGMMEVLFEKRTVSFRNSTLSDTWQPYDVHVYKLGKVR